MKLPLTLISASILVGGLALAPTARSGEQPAATTAAVPAKAVEGRVSGLEKKIERILQILSGKKQPTEPPKVTATKQSVPPTTPATAAAEQLDKRLEAAEKSLANIADVLAAKNQKVGDNCHWVKECVYITCCRWGAPPSDPGTVKCMEQCCGAWENKLVCN